MDENVIFVNSDVADVMHILVPGTDQSVVLGGYEIDALRDFLNNHRDSRGARLTVWRHD